ncbi:hypothetical protein ACJX0J_037235 [Zea mays]
MKLSHLTLMHQALNIMSFIILSYHPIMHAIESYFDSLNDVSKESYVANFFSLHKTIWFLVLLLSRFTKWQDNILLILLNMTKSLMNCLNSGRSSFNGMHVDKAHFSINTTLSVLLIKKINLSKLWCHKVAVHMSHWGPLDFVSLRHRNVPIHQVFQETRINQ